MIRRDQRNALLFVSHLPSTFQQPTRAGSEDNFFLFNYLLLVFVLIFITFVFLRLLSFLLLLPFRAHLRNCNTTRSCAANLLQPTGRSLSCWTERHTLANHTDHHRDGQWAFLSNRPSSILPVYIFLPSIMSGATKDAVHRSINKKNKS